MDFYVSQSFDLVQLSCNLNPTSGTHWVGHLVEGVRSAETTQLHDGYQRRIELCILPTKTTDQVQYRVVSVDRGLHLSLDYPVTLTCACEDETVHDRNTDISSINPRQTSTSDTDAQRL